MKIFSFSATFLNNLCCNRRANFAHNLHLNLKEPRPVYFEEGELGHLFFRYYYIEKRNGSTHKQALDAAEEKTRLFYSSGLELPVEDCERIIKLAYDNLEYWKNDNWYPIRVEEAFAVEFFRDNEYYIQNDDEDTAIAIKIDQVKNSDTPSEVKELVIKNLEDSKKGIILLAEGIIDLEVRESEGQTNIVDHKFISRNRDPDDLSYQFMLYCWAFGRTKIKINHVGKQKSLKPQDKFTRWIRAYSQEVLDDFKVDTTHKLLRWLNDDSDGIYLPDYSACTRFNTNCIYSKVCKTEPRMRESIIKMYYRSGEQYNPFKDRDKTGRERWAVE